MSRQRHTNNGRTWWIIDDYVDIHAQRTPEQIDALRLWYGRVTGQYIDVCDGIVSRYGQPRMWWTATIETAPWLECWAHRDPKMTMDKTL